MYKVVKALYSTPEFTHLMGPVRPLKLTPAR